MASKEEKAAAAALFAQIGNAVASSRPPYVGTDFRVADVNEDLKADYTVHDAWSQLGGNREQQTFDMRMMALSDPGGYAKLRNRALGDVKTITEGAFSNAYKQFVESGFSREEAKHMALQAASVTKNVQEMAMNKKFGGNDAIFMGTVQKQNAPTHTVGHSAGGVPAVRKHKRGRKKKH
jgi:hypothetical protein